MLGSLPLAHRTLLLSLAASACVVAGCRPAGPTYQKPTVQVPAQWRAHLPNALATPADVDPALAQWWKGFQDPVLDSLIERAVQGNLDLRRAVAAVREARARMGEAEADRFPTLTGSSQTGFQRASTRTGSASQAGFFRVGFDAGWELDVFGGISRSVETSEALLEASGEQLRDVLVSLLAEVALNYVELRLAQTRLAIAEENLRIQEDTLRLATERFNAGLSPRLDVDQAQYVVAETRSRIPTLHIRTEQAENRLAVLLGMQPGELAQELRVVRPIPVTPPEIALGVPADVLRRRPDIRRAERVLAAQTAAVGVAAAQRYPLFTLSGTIGYETITRGNPLSLGNIVGSAVGSVFQTIFDGGRIRRNIEIRTAIQEQALVDYESRILEALEEVENALLAYVNEQVRRRSLQEAAEAAARATELVVDNYRAGLVDFLSVLESQRALLSLRDQLAQSEAAVTSDLVRLYKALGGGWTPSPVAAAPTSPAPTGATQARP